MFECRANKVYRCLLGLLLVGGSSYCFIYIILHIQAMTKIFGYADMPIFLETTQRFLQDGALYSSSLADYRPGTHVYKYPPLLAALLLPLANMEPGLILDRMCFALAVIYVLASGYGLYLLKPQHHRMVYGSIMISLMLVFSPFFETLLGLQLEIPILVLLTACLGFIRKKYYFFAGATIAIAAALKVYPVFMMLYFCFYFSRGAWSGFLFTLSCLGILMLALFGGDINYWYISEVLPVLLRESALLDSENANLASFFVGVVHLDRSSALQISRGIFFILALVFTIGFVRRRKAAPQQTDDVMGFSFIIVLMLLGITNSWANYQLLLLIPFMVLVSCLLDAGNYRLLLWPGAAFLLTFFTDNTGINGLFLFPQHWHSEMVLYRGCATLILALVLLRVFWRETGLAAEKSAFGNTCG